MWPQMLLSYHTIHEAVELHVATGAVELSYNSCGHRCTIEEVAVDMSVPVYY